MRRLAIGALAAAAGCALAPGTASAHYLRTGQVAAFPAPGTISAFPGTAIAFRGRTAATLGRITVRGSRSGRMRGHLRNHSDGHGVSFVPAHAFRRGETVTVRTSKKIARTRGGDFSFRIARLISGPIDLRRGGVDTVRPGATWQFRSQPGLRPAVVTVTPGMRQGSTKYIALGPKPRDYSAQSGVLLIDNGGQPMYFRPMKNRGVVATDVRVQRYRGKPVLTWWQGTTRSGAGRGEIVIFDQRYHLVRRLRHGNGLPFDLHEFQITPDNTGLVTSYPEVHVDLRPVGGPKHGRVIDSVVQEIDLATGLVIFEWHALGTIALNESYEPLPGSRKLAWDYVHTNSADFTPDGDIVLSNRHTWAVYRVDRGTGLLEWRYGGKRSTLKLGPGAHVAWPHDARMNPAGTLTIFDNAAAPAVRKRSRAIEVAVDARRRTATLKRALTHPRNLLAATQGNVQWLPGGGLMVGWGSQRFFSEYSPAGWLTWDGRLSVGFDTYRAYRVDWEGRPTTLPRIAPDATAPGTDVYVSWNGATEVASWEVLGGPRATGLKPLATAPRQGFETRVALRARPRYVAVRARDAAGAALANSPPRRVPGR